VQATPEERAEDGMARWTLSRRPGRGIEIPIHQELTEREETEDDGSGIDRPARLRCDSFCCVGEVRADV
jgi:hypothetical protein